VSATEHPVRKPRCTSSVSSGRRVPSFLPILGFCSTRSASLRFLHCTYAQKQALVPKRTPELRITYTCAAAMRKSRPPSTLQRTLAALHHILT